MASKKPRTGQDIRRFFSQRPGSPSSSSSTQAGGATAFQTPTKVEQEMNRCDWMEGHPHQLVLIFSSKDRNKYTLQCDHPQTVLQAIKSHELSEKWIREDDKVLIQLGTAGDAPLVATHFPCSCIDNDETLVISCKSERVEGAQDERSISGLSRENYSVFQISTMREKPALTKRLFGNNVMKEYQFLSVYGVKGSTMEDALRRDGRFAGNLGNFTLSDFDKKSLITARGEKVDGHHGKRFQIQLPKKRENKENVPCGEQELALQMVGERGVSMEESGADREEIYKQLGEQVRELKRWMEDSFPDGSYQKTAQFKAEKFGKLQQSFSEVHKVRELMKHAKAVCKVIVKDVCTGTGFVLLDNLILTNAHLFGKCLEGRNLKEDVQVFVFFNYEAQEPETDSYYFTASNTLIDVDLDLDYAVLELNSVAKKCNPESKLKNTNIPPGLLGKFGPIPESGEACVIGHLRGEVKRMDPTWIIEKEKRRQVVDDHLDKFKDHMVTLLSVRQHLIRQGIDDILLGGKRADRITTYHTFLYHGASGSPVFDSRGQVFGLHTAGHTHDFISPVHVIEFSMSLLGIFENFVNNLRKENKGALLQQVEETAKSNKYLKKILQSLDEPMEQN